VKHPGFRGYAAAAGPAVEHATAHTCTSRRGLGASNLTPSKVQGWNEQQRDCSLYFAQSAGQTCKRSDINIHSEVALIKNQILQLFCRAIWSVSSI